jgi:hypothetical protein
MTREEDASSEWLRSLWLRGGSARPLVERLLELTRVDEAGALARLALAAENCPDRNEVERLLERVGKPPDGWTEAVVAFSRDPTIDKWDRLMQFTPHGVLYQRVRNTISTLRRLGTDPNAIFRCATRCGTVPDAIELVQLGEVDPAVVVERAEQAAASVRGIWYGLAAEAAFARGDTLGTVRLLKLACEKVSDGFGADISIDAIRSAATPELHEMLDKVGVQRG